MAEMGVCGTIGGETVRSAATMFSGIGAPELAMPGWNWRWCAETDPFASAVLAERFGHQNLGDVAAPDFADRSLTHGRPDVVVFGSPCQSFSIAGQRRGLADPRGDLALVALGVVGRIRPAWFVLENVPGLLSSDGGRDFGTLLGAVGDLGYGFAWRVLDAQHFGVAQRRRRVFVVGHLGDWRRAATLLFEPASLCGHPPPRREAGQETVVDIIKGTAIGRKPEAGPQRGDVISDGSCFTLTTNEVHAVAAPVASCPRGGSGYRNDTDRADDLITYPTLSAHEGGTLTHIPPIVVPALSTGGGKAGRGYPAVAYRTSPNCGAWETGDRTDSLTTGSDPSAHLVQQPAMAVRRLTPLECERLQGIPDGHTAITYRGKPTADGPRYRAIGNSMAVPVMRWILRRVGRISKCVT